MSIYLD